MAMLYLTGSVFFLWAWRNYKIDSLKKHGLYMAQINIYDLLSKVDDNGGKYHRVYDAVTEHESEGEPLMPSALKGYRFSTPTKVGKVAHA